MKKPFKGVLVLTVLILTLLALCGCSEEPSDTPEADDSFNVTAWLKDEDNAMMFTYIAVSTQPDGYEAVDESEKDFILAKLANVDFDAVQAQDDEWDFAFCMNEPFMFFTFYEDDLLVKVPNDTGYDYYAAQLGDYPELIELLDYIDAM